MRLRLDLVKFSKNPIRAKRLICRFCYFGVLNHFFNFFANFKIKYFENFSVPNKIKTGRHVAEKSYTI